MVYNSININKQPLTHQFAEHNTNDQNNGGSFFLLLDIYIVIENLMNIKNKLPLTICY
jgi:hypothetical protein